MPPPRSLARYMAASASRSRASGRACGPVAMAMPMLVRTKASSSPRTNGAASDAVGDRDRLVGARDLLAQDHELVAAEPRGGVARAQHVLEPVGDVDEQVV